MKVYLSFLAIFIGSFIFAQSPSLEVKIIQNGVVVQPKNGVYHLKNSEFSFEFVSNAVEGFLVGATFDDDVYRSALGKADLEVSWFSNTGIADGYFNPDKEIMVYNDAPSYWYFTNKKDHRFDKLSTSGTSKKYVAKRTVANFKDLSVNKTISLKNFKKSLFVFIYNGDHDENYNLINVKKYFNGELKFN